MRRIDPNEEYLHMVSQLDLRPGEIAVDTQAEPDNLIRALHEHVGERGRVIALTFGQKRYEDLTEQVTRMKLSGAEVHLGHPATGTGVKSGIAHAVILRHTGGFLRLTPVLQEFDRVSRPGARIVLRHTDWNVQLPKVTAEEQAMLDALSPQAVADGRDLFARAERFGKHLWRDVRYDVYTVASRDGRAAVRYGYDWKTMMRDQLGKARVFAPREILDLITRLDTTRGAKVAVDRYLLVGIKR